MAEIDASESEGDADDTNEIDAEIEKEAEAEIEKEADADIIPSLLPPKKKRKESSMQMASKVSC